MKKLLLVAAFAVAGITGTVSAKNTVEPTVKRVECTTTTTTQTTTTSDGSTPTTTTTTTKCKDTCGC